MLAQIMGVLNVTPDSFSDGGDHFDPGLAAERAESLRRDGADIIDVGGESTKPGAPPVPEEEEWRRLAPVLKHLSQLQPPVTISVDTRKPSIMLKAADLGAGMINHVGGIADQATLERLSRYPGMQYLSMHMQGEPHTMQLKPMDAAGVGEVSNLFATYHRTLLAAGFPPEHIWLDPGIGFGKSDPANMRCMMQIQAWAQSYQIAIGISRKSFIGRTLDISAPKERDDATKMLELGLVLCGARLVRTHDVRRLRRLLNLAKRDD